MDPLTNLKASLADRYEIIRQIGTGGMATVYLARDLRHQRDVAVKLLKPELGAVLGPERFLSEIRVTAKLQHPNLLPLFDSGESDGQLWYVMPFVEGESLRQKVEREHQLSVREAVRIASAVAGALDYAHRHGVIHRDLKPENILLNENQPLVADFGIALAVSNAGGERVTQTGLSLGTPQYMSPEQATGERGVDGRTDIYSLGAVLYEMLTGEPPHTGATVQAIIARVITDTPRSVRLTRSSVPEYVDAAIQKALEKVPADRFETAKEFAEVLEGQKPITSSRTAAIVAPSGGRTAALASSPSAARRIPWILAGVAGIVAVTTAIGWWQASRNAAMSRADTVTFVVTPAGRESIDPVTLAISPDGRKIVYRGEEANHSQLYMRNVGDLNAVRIRGTEEGEMPFFSPDGKWLAFFASGELKRIPTDGGTPITVARNLMARPSWWMKDNRILIPTEAVTRARSGFSAVPASGGIPTVVIVSDTAHRENMRAAIAVGDGGTILFSSLGPGGIEDDNLAIGSADGPDYKVFDFLSTKPLGYVDGYVICVRWDGVQGTVLAIPFDLRRRKITGDPVALLTGIGTVLGAALSESGTLGYISGVSTSQLVWEDGSAKTDTLLSDLRAYAIPRISPDGDHIAFWLPGATNGDVWIYSISAKTLSRLTNGTATAPEWTPDGKKIMWVRPGTALAGIWIQPIDGSGPAEQLKPKTPAGLGIPISAMMSPDGSTILFSAFGGARRRDIYYFKPGAENVVRPWLATDADEQSARFSPDGRWVAYASDESGAVEVYVRAFPGPAGRVQVSSSGGSEPMWSRDGRHLFYRSGPKLMQADISLGAGVSVGARRPIMAMNIGINASANYDVSADGKRILSPKRTGGDVNLVVVTNWLTEVRRKLRGAGK